MLAHPNDVAREDIERQVAKQEPRIASHHKVEGLVFPNWIELTEDGREQRDPRLDAVADTALFNGIYLAGLVAKYDATSDPAVLGEVGGSVDAVYKLTHITGMPGLLSRYALPLERAVHSGVIPAAAEAGSTRSSYRHIYYGDPRNVRPEYSHLDNIVAGRDGLAPVRRSPVGRLLTGQAHYGDQYLCTRTYLAQVRPALACLLGMLRARRRRRSLGGERPPRLRGPPCHAHARPRRPAVAPVRARGRGGPVAHRFFGFPIRCWSCGWAASTGHVCSRRRGGGDSCCVRPRCSRISAGASRRPFPTRFSRDCRRSPSHVWSGSSTGWAIGRRGFSVSCRATGATTVGCAGMGRSPRLLDFHNTSSRRGDWDRSARWRAARQPRSRFRVPARPERIRWCPRRR